MEPVPGTRTVRRTVRVAVALLLGQAVMVAVIGWVTYRYSPAHRHRGAAVVDQMAGAPRVLPPAGGPVVGGGAPVADLGPAPVAPGDGAPGRPRASIDLCAAFFASADLRAPERVPGAHFGVPAAPGPTRTDSLAGSADRVARAQRRPAADRPGATVGHRG